MRFSRLFVLAVMVLPLLRVPAVAMVLESSSSAFPHTVDGAFTAWPPSTASAPHEWHDIPPYTGKFCRLYLDYQDGDLHVLNDWVENSEGILTSDYYLVILSSGFDRWELFVYGDNTTMLLKNGKPDASAQGSYGFGRSPNLGAKHTIIEVSLRIPPDIVKVELLGVNYLRNPPAPDPTFPKGMNVDFRTGKGCRSAPAF